MRKNLDTVEEYWSRETLAEAYSKVNDNSLERFANAFASYLGVSQDTINIVSSGKSALKGLLQSKKDRRSLVMVPAFNCGRVKDAIEEAGCTVLTYDFEPAPGRFDWDLILDSVKPEVGALVVTHFFGVPIDLRKAREVCLKKGIILIEDCAQTLGGTIAGRQVGTWGDAAIFSFSYDKPISLGWGGAAVVNSPDMFGQSLSNSLSTLDQTRQLDLFQTFLKSLEVRRSRIAMNKLSLSYILHRIYNSQNLGVFYEEDMPLSELQAELGILCLERFAEVRSVRNGNSDIFAALCPLPTWPIMNSDIDPSWLKQKVFVTDLERLNLLSRALQKRGVRAGNFNWPSLLEGQGSQSCLNASQVAKFWIDIPIHQRINLEEIESIVSVLTSYA